MNPHRPAVLCAATGIANCMDSRVFYGQVVRKYLQCHVADATALEVALQACDTERACLIVHTLVASSATVGALALEQQSRVVLAALRSAPFAPSAAMIQALALAHTQALCALGDWLQAPVQLHS
jgi:hypothetical protein